MPFSVKNLNRVAEGGETPGNTSPGNRQTLWIYATNDAVSVVEAANYFNPARPQGMAKGDLIDAAIAVGGTIVRKDYVVTAGGHGVNVTIKAASS